MQCNERAALEARIEAMERRIAALEGWNVRLAVQARDGQTAARYQKLVDKYGETMTKKAAADVIGVTRVTIYNMISDGRLEAAADGRVITQSVAAYLTARASRLI